MAAAELASAWWSWIGPATIESSVLIAVAWLVDRATARRAWPQLLLALWLAALARRFLPGSLASPLSVTRPIGAAAGAATERLGDGAPLGLLALVWLAGVATCFACRFLRRSALAGRVRDLDSRDARSREWIVAVRRAAARLGARVPRTAVLDGLAQPAVLGALRPRLVLPASWASRAPRDADRHALLHEVAHVRRGDLWLDEICAVARALFWFDPLAWIAVARVRALGEFACDAEVARALGPEARGYRDALVRAAAESLGLASPAGMRAFIAHPAAMVVRIQRLSRAAPAPPALARAASLGVAVLLAACVLPMAPRAADLRDRARAVFAAERRGEMQSCFTLQAAALVLADESRPSPRSDR